MKQVPGVIIGQITRRGKTTLAGGFRSRKSALRT
jgi:hypothetical protein